MSDLAQIRADTDTYLGTWGESLVRKRLSSSYNAMREVVESWDSNDLAISGDWQPLTGAERRAEYGLAQKSEAKIITAYDTLVAANDRITRSSITYRVNYVQAFEDHLSIFVYREARQ